MKADVYILTAAYWNLGMLDITGPEVPCALGSCSIPNSAAITGSGGVNVSLCRRLAKEILGFRTSYANLFEVWKHSCPTPPWIPE